VAPVRVRNYSKDEKSSMSWCFHNAAEIFDQYQDAWDEINRARGNHILLDSIFVKSLIHYFAGEDVLLGISNDSKNPALVLVERVRKGVWQTFQPSQAPLGLILWHNIDEINKQLDTLIRSLPGYALSFAIMQQDPDFTACRNLQLSQKIELVPYIETPRLTLSSNFEGYWKSRRKNLVHNLSRQHRRLVEKGIRLELIENRDSAKVADNLRTYGMLEALGWKGSQGTAITIDNQQGLFYREILEEFCSRDNGVIYQLLMDGKVVASDICLERNGMMIILKTAYDESVKNFSLGLLMHQKIIERVFSEKRNKVIEFYGRVCDWHTQWTDEIRTMYHLNIYRHGLFGTAHSLIYTTRKKLRSRTTQ
jgi:hypothetical protein